MDKIPFAENLQECLPSEYGQNLAEMTEIHLQAMYEDNRRWRECEERFKPLLAKQRQEEPKQHEIRAETAKIKAWLDSLMPEIYRDDMRRRMNRLREKYKGA